MRFHPRKDQGEANWSLNLFETNESFEERNFEPTELYDVGTFQTGVISLFYIMPAEFSFFTSQVAEKYFVSAFSNLAMSFLSSLLH